MKLTTKLEAKIEIHANLIALNGSKDVKGETARVVRVIPKRKYFACKSILFLFPNIFTVY